jgi:tellurite methyltransferase
MDAEQFLSDCDKFDVVVMYGLLHCLPSIDRIRSVVRSAMRKTKIGGHHIVVTFNDGPHDLSAHPDLVPTLLPHDFFLELYGAQEVLYEKADRIEETHPHNKIPHFHSVTRLIVKKVL